MWGLKDAPREFGMRLSRSLQDIGYQQGLTDRQTWGSLTRLQAGNRCSLWLSPAVDKLHLHSH
eukprot:5409025-Prorocentrum_lima.AAC.1